jgi:hypothetical protein
MQEGKDEDIYGAAYCKIKEIEKEEKRTENRSLISVGTYPV